MIDVAVKKIDELEAKLKIAIEALESIDDLDYSDIYNRHRIIKEALEQVGES